MIELDTKAQIITFSERGDVWELVSFLENYHRSDAIMTREFVFNLLQLRDNLQDFLDRSVDTQGLKIQFVGHPYTEIFNIINEHFGCDEVEVLKI